MVPKTWNTSPPAAEEGNLLGEKDGGVPRSVGSNGETVLRLKGERAFEVWRKSSAVAKGREGLGVSFSTQP